MSPDSGFLNKRLHDIFLRIKTTANGPRDSYGISGGWNSKCFLCADYARICNIFYLTSTASLLGSNITERFLSAVVLFTGR